MAILLAVGGAYFGSAIGIGASLGWLAGSVAGNLLFPSSASPTGGPQLADLSVSSSAYGAPIPIGYGTIRVAGNMIWSSGIDEKKTTENVGGILGIGGQEVSSYLYSANFAMALAEGPADNILRIWADGKLIYDIRGEEDNIRKKGLRFRFYSGTETQEPDSIIQSHEGIAATPAHRGLCYIVFENLELLDFGNRIPQLTFELTFEGTDTTPTKTADLYTVAEGGISSSWQVDQVAVDYERGLFYQRGSNVTSVRRLDTSSMTENRQSVIEGASALEIFYVLPDGYLMARTTGGNSSRLSAINPDSLQITSSFGSQNNDLINSPTGFVSLGEGKSAHITAFGKIDTESEEEPTTVRHFFFTGDFWAGALGLIEVLNGLMIYIWDSDTANLGVSPTISSMTDVIGNCPGLSGSGFGEGYSMMNLVEDIHIYKFKVITSAHYYTATGQTHGVFPTHVGVYVVSDFIDGATAWDWKTGLCYDQTDDSIMFQFEVTAGSGIGSYMTKIQPSTGEIIWTTSIPATRSDIVGFNQSNISNSIFAQSDNITLGRVWALDTITGIVFYNVSGGWGVGWNLTGMQWFDGDTNTIMGYAATPSRIIKWILFRGEGDGVPLSDIVTNLSGKVGLSPSDIDVSDLTTTIVPGYAIGRQIATRASIQPLSSVYNFDGVESDYLLKFPARDGKTISATILQEDLVAGESDDRGLFFSENRIQEVELPSRFSLTYMDRNNDYLQQTHSANRVLGPFSTMNSKNEITLPVAIALDATFAKQVAERSLYSAWIERSNYNTKIPWTYLTLDPADLVNIDLLNGTQLRTRLVNTDVGGEFSVEIAALSENAAQYDSSATAYEGEFGPVQEIRSIVTTKGIILCSPLLMDAHDASRGVTQSYFALGGYGQPGWRTGLLYQSAEGIGYIQIGSSVEEMAWGATGDALADVEDPARTDEINTIRVYMNTGSDQLSSVTQLQMLNGSNLAALVHLNGIDVEIIHYRDVLANDDGSFTLSGFLRGRRGTEVFTSGHSAGDIFLLLTTDTVDRFSMNIGEINAPRFYRAITSGGLLEDALVTSKASPGNDLKPYAPASFVGSGLPGSDITYTWIRRTRVGGQLRGGTGIVPLSEDTEEYRLDILNGLGGAILRSISSITETATYTAAQQTSDASQIFATITIPNASFETGLDDWTASIPADWDTFQTSRGNISAPQDGTYFIHMDDSITPGGTLTQDVDLSTWISIIEAGLFECRLSAYTAGDASSSDTLDLTLVWLDSEGATISTSSGTSGDPDGAGNWLLVQETDTAPVNAVAVRLTLFANNVSSSRTDIGIDNVVLEQRATSDPPVNAIVYQVSAQVGIGFPSDEITIG